MSLHNVSLASIIAFQNATNLTAEPVAPAAMRPFFSWLLKIFYIVGIFGNLAAIIALRRGERRMRNRKHLLMLTTLAANDLVALLGMMAMMLTSDHHPWVVQTRWYCALRVVLRVFGIGSVCITVVMSLERWLALTRPFLYQKQVTYTVIRTGLLFSWGLAATLTCMPLLGLGLYYDTDTGKCTRYRNAETHTDITYAVAYVIFGTILCVVLVYCNLMVIKALYAISAPNSQDRLTVRRISKNSSSKRSNSNKRNNSTLSSRNQPCLNTATVEEVAFSRLMATLSVLFMICWLPQMITSMLYLSLHESKWHRLEMLAKISDMLMLLNYTLDPYLYVLLRRNRYSLKRCLVDLCSRGKFWQSHKTSTESIKTSSCPQESLLTTDNGSEFKVVPSKHCDCDTITGRDNDKQHHDNYNNVML